MNKTLKLLAVMVMMMVVVCTSTPMVLAETSVAEGTTPSGLIEKIDPDLGGVTAAGDLIDIANKVIGLIQVASAVLAVILIAVFGFKFILGSANEKADYQKSFIPLIVGVVVVFAATSIAKLLFGLIG